MNASIKKRFFEYGFKVGLLKRGQKNTIADVSGVRVGHFTKIQGEDVRTGITIIDSGVDNIFQNKLPAAIAVGNAFGKLAGYTQVEELGTMEAPIALTNVNEVGPVITGLTELVIRNTSILQPTDSINVVVGETNNWILNDIHKSTILPKDVLKAYKECSADVKVGNVGAGTGTRAFSWKGGIGSASRIARIENGNYVVGILTQTNFGGSLSILGVPIGEKLGESDFKEIMATQDGGSCNVVIATDAPLTSRQLKRLAKRAFLGLARTGSVMANASGDYAIAFTTSRYGLEGGGSIGYCIPEKNLTPFFLAVVEAVEESVYDAIFAAETMSGRNGNVLKMLPIETVMTILDVRGARENL